MPVAVLVVDDSMLIRHAICRFLEERGFSVESATNGQEAIEHIKRRVPGIIITDMNMPTMSGSELITALKSNPETASIPVIIVSGRGSGLNEREPRADFSIFKDIDIEDQLTDALQAVLGTKSALNVSGC